jgi:hypothetical protein
MTEDPKLSRRYRDLPREEPPRHLDDAILAKARRAVEARPAPLVAPTGRRRWYVPVAAAAIIVLAVAVTLHVERERPDDAERVVTMKAEPVAPPREEPRVMQAPAPAKKAAPERPATKSFVPDPQPQAGPAPAPASPPLADSAAQGREDYERRAAAAELARLQGERQLQRAERQAAASARADSAEEPRRQQRARVLESTPASSALGSAAAYQSPEQWLLGIDDLKRQGKHEEAEKQLAEFRKRYPDYRIPEAITEKFEKAR